MRTEFIQPIGVRVYDLDVDNSADMSKLKNLVHKNGFAVLPAGSAAPATPAVNTIPSIIKIGSLFGKPSNEHNAVNFIEKDCPVGRLVTGRAGVAPDSFKWHNDTTWWDTPPLAEVLSCVEKPPTGGRTSFQSTNGMLRRLSPENREFLLKTRFKHSFHHAYTHCDRPEIAETKLEEWTTAPGVIAHPVTGLPCCYVNEGNTCGFDGLDWEEAREKLEKVFHEMYDWGSAYSHEWTVGDVVVWDNFAVQHHAEANYEERRVMHKLAIKGNFKHLEAYYLGR